MSSKRSTEADESTQPPGSEDERPEPESDDGAGSEATPAAAPEPEPAEDTDDQGPEDAAAGAADEPRESDNRFQLWFLVAAFAAVAVALLVVLSTGAWDPFACETDDDCRGLKLCIEGHCASPEVWERQHGAPPPLSEAGEGEGTE